MSSTSLRLYPANPALAPNDIAHFFAALQTVGLMDPVVAFTGSVPYAHGPRFYELITFQTSHMVMKLGIIGNQVQELGLVDSRELCRIAFSEISPEQEFLGMGNTRPPRCPVCGREVSEWQHIMDLWFENKIDYRWRCPFYDSETDSAAWDWQHSAAIARFTLDIQGIRHDEAYPGAELLKFLADFLGGKWNYFYCRV